MKKAHHDDARLVITARALRTFGYGCTSVLLAGMLDADGASPLRIGLVLASAAGGCVTASALMGLFADRCGRRTSLLISACLMGIAGLVFAISESYACLVAAAFIGTISPSTSDNTPFSGVEQSILAQTTPPGRHAAVFTRYNVTAQAAGALGGLAAAALGMFPAALAGDASFALYSMIAFATAALFLRLSPEIEVPRAAATVAVAGGEADASQTSVVAHVPATTRRILTGLTSTRRSDGPMSQAPATQTASVPVRTPGSFRRLRTRLTGTRRLDAATSQTSATPRTPATPRVPATVRRLAGLFAVDAFAGGLAVQTVLAWWFHHRFGASMSELGLVFFAANLLPAVAQLAAPRLIRRHGLLPAMLVPHLVSNLLLACVPLASDLGTAVVLLLARQTLSKIDVPARQAFTAALVGPEHRTAAASLTTIARSVAVSASPIAATALLAGPLAALGAPLLLGAALAVGYDVAMWRSFRSVPVAD